MPDNLIKLTAHFIKSDKVKLEDILVKRSS